MLLKLLWGLLHIILFHQIVYLEILFLVFEIWPYRLELAASIDQIVEESVIN